MNVPFAMDVVLKSLWAAASVARIIHHLIIALIVYHAWIFLEYILITSIYALQGISPCFSLLTVISIIITCILDST